MKSPTPLELRESAVSSVHLASDSPRLRGHFPGSPIFPAVATLHDLVLPAIERRWPELTSVAKVRRLKFARPIRPGADLTIHVTRLEGTARVDFVVAQGSVTCAEGTLHFRGRE
jgi:3-hydroxyacyl-[acyl-carrier-protein] dehydratase